MGWGRAQPGSVWQCLRPALLTGHIVTLWAQAVRGREGLVQPEETSPGAQAPPGTPWPAKKPGTPKQGWAAPTYLQEPASGGPRATFLLLTQSFLLQQEACCRRGHSTVPASGDTPSPLGSGHRAGRRRLNGLTADINSPPCFAVRRRPGVMHYGGLGLSHSAQVLLDLVAESGRAHFR